MFRGPGQHAHAVDTGIDVRRAKRTAKAVPVLFEIQLAADG